MNSRRPTESAARVTSTPMTMNQILAGWRKLGCVLLVAAVPLLLMWVRSRSHLDHVWMAFGNTSHHLFSCDGAVRWESMNLPRNPRRPFLYLPKWESKPRPIGLVPPGEEYGTTWHWKCAGFYFGDDGNHPIRIIPYWAIVLPPILTAAGIFLRPRRVVDTTKKPDRHNDDPVST